MFAPIKQFLCKDLFLRAQIAMHSFLMGLGRAATYWLMQVDALFTMVHDCKWEYIGYLASTQKRHAISEVDIYFLNPRTAMLHYNDIISKLFP